MKHTFAILLAAACTAAAVSCSQDREIELLDPNQERNVVITANIEQDPATRAVSVSGEAIATTWSESDQVALVYENKVISTLRVASIKGASAQLVGTVKGAYPKDTPFTLYYGGTSYTYYGQQGTAESASTRGYLKADVTIKKQDNKTLILSPVTLEHQQAYFQLQFRWGPDLIKVRKLTVDNLDPNLSDPTVIEGKIAKSWSLSQPDQFNEFSGLDNDVFTVYTNEAEGLTTVFFAMRDNSPATSTLKYRFTVTDINNRTYTAHAKEMPSVGPVRNGNYYAGEWLLD